MNEINWPLINSFAPWFSALGTIAAVITSLFLASRDKVKIKGWAGHRIMITLGSSHQGELIELVAVNVGERTVTITDFGWAIKSGSFFRRRTHHFVQIGGGSPLSDKLPKRIHDGEKARLLIDIDREDNDAWHSRFVNDAEKNKYDLSTLTLLVGTSVGKSFKFPAESNLIQLLQDEIAHQAQSAQDR